MRIHSIGFKVGATRTPILCTRIHDRVPLPPKNCSFVSPCLQNSDYELKESISAGYQVLSFPGSNSKKAGGMYSQIRVPLILDYGRPCAKSHLSVRRACMFHYGQWNPERYLSEHGRMKFLQYGTGCAGECSEVTKSTVPYLLNTILVQMLSIWGII